MTVRFVPIAAFAVAAALAGCSSDRAPASRWTMAPETASLAGDEALRQRIFTALDAAEHAGTDPGISNFRVRCATVVGTADAERVILGGNSEYELPEAIHGETSIMNHAITELGSEAARESVGFIAFYSEQCGGGGSCGDCRDYLMKTTRYRDLLIACGQASDHTVHLQRFSDYIVPEETFPEGVGDQPGLSAGDVERLIEAAHAARRGGIALFTGDDQHLGAAALSTTGRIYRAAGADDAAFHYRYPIGGALQQAATEGDYYITAVAVSGPPGEVPLVSYRDRQYGYEFSSFGRRVGHPPTRLILSVEPDRYRITTFEDALPHAFSTADFMPEALDRFLEAHTVPAPR